MTSSKKAAISDFEVLMPKIAKEMSREREKNDYEIQKFGIFQKCDPCLTTWYG